MLAIAALQVELRETQELDRQGAEEIARRIDRSTAAPRARTTPLMLAIVDVKLTSMLETSNDEGDEWPRLSLTSRAQLGATSRRMLDSDCLWKNLNNFGPCRLRTIDDALDAQLCLKRSRLLSMVKGYDSLKKKSGDLS